ncbi:beta-ketoacyl-ACP synthase I [bacterium endosymbiont of Pedicinus badii]|uniref:beta-ketoacyl-ACP synthase I n=1 Tax=bacterium endosymbiont of Pedicinus badii TaxID=1719126 RepID=UPI0009B95B2D|nr:beta-ketoacyl-ACP synthase I [bacterium endosymbiont of Pedicinus badii]OQM34466.1 3-oxoacyl-ACP synthase [bacterium endosymbiont of Pedicinus badii]
MKRAVITGIGILSSIGSSKKEVLYSLKKGQSGITFSEEFRDSGMKSHVWGNIKIDVSENIDRKMRRFMNDASIYSYICMQQAISDSNLTKSMISNERTGLIIGSGGGSPRNQSIVFSKMKSEGLKGVGPYMVPKSMNSGISACLGTFFKIKGISYSISSACSTSAHCIGNAFEMIQFGKQDLVFAGGGEELSWEIACEFDAMRALSTNYNHTPEKSSRAYDAHRDGFVISGGAGIIVVEELQHAIKRNAHIYAEIVGYGANSDGFNMVIPSGEGAIRCMKNAIKDIDSPIDYINVHGTSTKIGDIKELLAIKETFGEKHPCFSSTKSMTGHSLGASGVHEIIFSLLMLENNFIAPSINIEKVDSNVKGMNLITKYTKKKLNTIMTNSFGFGGTNVSLVIKKIF